MDLSLKGSQINLVCRSKPKLPTVKYAIVANAQQKRPSSASIYQRRSLSSTSLHLNRRPQSADPKFGRNISSRACEGDFQACKLEKLNSKGKRYQSVSSSNLLKLLLDEPIKRSWLCRRDSDNHSSCTSSLNGRRSVSVEDNINSERLVQPSANFGQPSNNCHQRTLSARGVPHYKTTSYSMPNHSEETSYSSCVKHSSNYWLTNAAVVSDQNKSNQADLPGRVSFSKSTDMNNEIDLSDCENDKQQGHYKECKGSDVPAVELAESPLFDETLCNSAALKKSVHFGAAKVQAETYEYPKCPSENCSCSTRTTTTTSSSVKDQPLPSSLHASKCLCQSPNCGLRSMEIAVRKLETTPGVVSTESDVIRDYKNAIAEQQLENSIAKNILQKDREVSSATHQLLLNNMEVQSSYSQHQYAMRRRKSEPFIEKQNNLSEVVNTTNTNNTATRNLVHPGNDCAKANGTISSESIMNNYFKVSSSAAPAVAAIKKKLNHLATTENNQKSKKTSSSSFAATSFSRAGVNCQKTKNSASFGSLRDDSNLSEFQLDKVDSWMSIQNANGPKSVAVPPPLHRSVEDDFEKFSKDSIECSDEAEEEEDRAADTSHSSSSKSDDSTYEEIVSVIKEIEEDKKKDNYAQRQPSDTDLKLNIQRDTSDSDLPVSSKGFFGGKNKGPEAPPDKYKDILNYLDDVEDSCDKTLLETRRSIPETNRSEMEFVVEPDIAEDVPKLSDLLMLPNHQLARRVIGLSLRANELANAVYLSKEHVMKIRTEKQKCIRTEKQNSANRLREQKTHFETIVARHQGFIEQLLKDKGSLCEKVAALTRRLESQNQAWEHKLQTEVARVKETTMAGEKIRREKWVRENTKKIKELTVKGLEAEINKMTCNHQRETTELKRAHQQELLDAVDEARQKHEQIESTIRDACAQDRETIIEKERNTIRDRFERQLEAERKSFDEQKIKLSDEFTAERNRLHAELKEKDLEYHTKRQEIQREKEIAVEQAVCELQEKQSKQEASYQNRINTIQKQYESDFAIWKKEFESTCKMRQVENENNIRQHYRTERDRQIDAIVSRMDAEAVKNAEEFETKINRTKEKYEKDLREVEAVEKSLREKYTDARNRLAESDAQVRNHQAEVKQLQIELDHSKKMCSEFLSERDQLRENVRSEVQSEVATLKSERDIEIQRIHKRVQQAIEKKDTTLELLQKENGTLRERCIKLEAIIRQQRKDYCVK